MAMHNPPHPGEFIRETYIEPFDISIGSLAESLGGAASTLARIVSDQCTPKPELPQADILVTLILCAVL